ncbi:hypothetical protein AAGC94_07880 [Clostridium sporogenes]|uniref:hypothetical protein n=1 Tax=Clostridium sporogenes TaxID=1509 RepID=UPI0022375789|nr:hypothetical protein [Clostridium sporogenes]MCW6091349.1 hypothetical protein [Clostridium sporogenes]
MNCKDTINLTNEWLKSIPDIRNHIGIIDIALKKGSYSIDNIARLKRERYKPHGKIYK